MIFGVARSFVSDDFAAQTVSLGGKLDAVVIIIDVLGEALVSNFSMCLHSCSSSEIDERMSCTGYRNCLTVRAKSLACDLVTLRCVLDGHVEVPHLTDAEEDRYSSLFKDVDVCTAWRSCVISKMQGPIYPGGLSVCKSELGLGRDVLMGDDVLHWFDGLSKTLGCMPAAHGSGTSVVQDRIGRIVLRVDDRRHQLCCQKAVICCDGQIVF